MLVARMWIVFRELRASSELFTHRIKYSTTHSLNTSYFSKTKEKMHPLIGSNNAYFDMSSNINRASLWAMLRRVQESSIIWSFLTIEDSKMMCLATALLGVVAGARQSFLFPCTRKYRPAIAGSTSSARFRFTLQGLMLSGALNDSRDRSTTRH